MAGTPSDSIRADALDLLRRLVAFDTESSRSNLPLIDAVAEYCRDIGLEPIVVPNGDGSKAALFVTVGPQRDGGVLLSGHTDCVPVAGQSWTTDPFTLSERDGRLYGRGACDMKGFDALALAMLPVWQAAGLARPVHLLLSYDEEVTCLGPMDTIARFGLDLPRPALAVVGEPTLMGVADAHKSVCTYRTTVHGVEAHSAKPKLGANAIAAACDLVVELTRMAAAFERDGEADPRFDPPSATVHVGEIHGGTARNILARRCSLLWEYRGLPAMGLRVAYDAFEDYAARTALPALNRYTDGGRIETEIEVEVPSLRAEPGSEAELLALRLSRSNRTVAVPFATEAGRFQGAGIPTVVCGPGSIDQAHQPDEYIALDQIDAGLAFLVRLGEECR